MLTGVPLDAPPLARDFITRTLVPVSGVHTVSLVFMLVSRYESIHTSATRPGREPCRMPLPPREWAIPKTRSGFQISISAPISTAMPMGGALGRSQREIFQAQIQPASARKAAAQSASRRAAHCGSEQHTQPMPQQQQPARVAEAATPPPPPTTTPADDGGRRRRRQADGRGSDGRRDAASQGHLGRQVESSGRRGQRRGGGGGGGGTGGDGGGGDGDEGSRASEAARARGRRRRRQRGCERVCEGAFGRRLGVFTPAPRP